MDPLAPRALARFLSAAKPVTFVDAYLALGRAVGKSVVYEGKLEYDLKAPAFVMLWAKAFKALKPKAKAAFQRVVKKVRLREPRGSEDASWEGGGVLALVVGKPFSTDVGALYITHELGHGVEEAHGVKTHEAPWGQPPFVSDYAASKPHVEDFAESFAMYVTSPSELERLAPEKFQDLKKLSV